MTSEKQNKEIVNAELDDEQLDRAVGGREEDSMKRCKRCGSRRSILFAGYCPRCRAELGI